MLTSYWRLIRPRVVALVLLAMAVSAWLAAGNLPSPMGSGVGIKGIPSPFGRGAGGEGLLWLPLAHALIGSSLVIAGAIAINQRIEWRGDAIMFRTADRPLPTGRLSRRQVTIFGVVATVMGLVDLAVVTNLTLTLLAAIGWLMYAAIYTPLKTRSAWQTPIGAVAGAIPVLLGAAAVGQPLNPWALILFGAVYCWQFPHSMAIAWRYRREFEAAGVKVATVTDPTGRIAGIGAVLGATALLPISLAPLPLGLASVGYGVIAAAFGMAYLAASFRFALRRDDRTAHQLLLASLVYLPALLIAMLAS